MLLAICFRRILYIMECYSRPRNQKTRNKYHLKRIPQTKIKNLTMSKEYLNQTRRKSILLIKHRINKGQRTWAHGRQIYSQLLTTRGRLPRLHLRWKHQIREARVDLNSQASSSIERRKRDPKRRKRGGIKKNQPFLPFLNIALTEENNL